MMHGSRPWTGLDAAIAAFGALVHVVAIPAGPAWYAWFGAPPVVVAGIGFALGLRRGAAA